MDIKTVSMKKYYHLKAAVVTVLVVFLLSSCIGIESRIRISNDGSGQLTLKYRVSQLITHLESTETNGNVVPLPLSREEFERTVKNTDGLELVSYSRKKDGVDIHIEAKVNFNSIEALSAMDNRNENSFSLRSEQGNRVISQIIYAGSDGEAPTRDSLEMIGTFFSGYNLTFIVETPTEIYKYNLGELSADKRSVTYQISIPEILGDTMEKIFEVSW
jgi:hypothetical protein